MLHSLVSGMLSFMLMSAFLTLGLFTSCHRKLSVHKAANAQAPYHKNRCKPASGETSTTHFCLGADLSVAYVATAVCLLLSLPLPEAPLPW